MEGKHVYHERQRLQFCLLHALNNLFQEKDSFTRNDLNCVADHLTLDDPDKDNWTPLSLIFKAHHNVWTGNYDVNVLIAALEARSKNVVWHDRRLGASSINLAARNLMGILLNIPLKRFGGLWKSRHWVTIRKINCMWYNLDSDLREPMTFKDDKVVTDFLDSIICQGGEVFVILDE